MAAEEVAREGVLARRLGERAPVHERKRRGISYI